MFINDELDADAVHSQGAAKGTRFAHQYRTALAQRTIDGFHTIGLPAALWAGTVGRRREDPSVRLPLIGKIPSAPAITGR